MVNPGPVTLRGRLAAESMMVDACTITRKTSEVTDTDTGVVTPTFSTLYTGACRIQQAAGVHAREAESGEAVPRLLRLEVQLPISVTGLQTEDLVTVASSVYDGDLAGRVFRIRDLAHKTHATARRVRAEEVT